MSEAFLFGYTSVISSMPLEVQEYDVNFYSHIVLRVFEEKLPLLPYQYLFVFAHSVTESLKNWAAWPVLVGDSQLEPH